MMGQDGEHNRDSLKLEWQKEFSNLGNEFSTLKSTVPERGLVLLRLSAAIDAGNVTQMHNELIRHGNLCAELKKLADLFQLQTKIFAERCEAEKALELKTLCSSYRQFYEKAMQESLQVAEQEADFLETIHRKMVEWELRNLCSELEIKEALQKWIERLTVTEACGNHSLAKQIELRIAILNDKLSN